MIPNMDPKKMQQLMRQMGINSKEVSAKVVIIETEDGNILIKNPQVTEITMQGQKSFQIAGEVTFEDKINEEDLKLIMEQANCTKEQALDALKKTNGNIAEAIVFLNESK